MCFYYYYYCTAPEETPQGQPTTGPGILFGWIVIGKVWKFFGHFPCGYFILCGWMKIALYEQTSLLGCWVGFDGGCTTQQNFVGCTAHKMIASIFWGLVRGPQPYFSLAHWCCEVGSWCIVRLARLGSSSPGGPSIQTRRPRGAALAGTPAAVVLFTICRSQLCLVRRQSLPWLQDQTSLPIWSL